MAVTLDPIINSIPAKQKNNRGMLVRDVLKQLPPTMQKYEINTTFRLIYFLGQCAAEVEEFIYATESGTGAQYEGRTSLGNTQPGDGVRFKGRGAIQLTGRGHYTNFGKHLGVDLTAKPELVADDPRYYWWAGGWYVKFSRPKFYAYCDAGPITDSTILTLSIAVNGKNKKTGMPNHYDKRKRYTLKYAACYGQTNQTVTAPISATNPIATPVVTTTTQSTPVTNNGATQPAAASAGCSDLSKQDGKLKSNASGDGAGDVDFDPVPPPKRDTPIRSDGGLNHRFYQKPSKDGLPATLEEMVNKKNKWYKRYWAFRPNEGLGYGSEKFETSISQNSKNLIASVIPYWPPPELNATGSTSGSKQSDLTPKATVNGSWKNLISGQGDIKSVWDVPILLNTYDVGVFNQNIGYVFEAGNELHMTILPEKTIINRGKGLGIGTGTNTLTTEKANKDASWQYWPKWDGIWVKHCLNSSGYTTYAGIDVSVDEYHQTILSGGKGGGKLINIPGHQEVEIKGQDSTSGTSGTLGTSGVTTTTSVVPPKFVGEGRNRSRGFHMEYKGIKYTIDRKGTQSELDIRDDKTWEDDTFTVASTTIKLKDFFEKSDDEKIKIMDTALGINTSSGTSGTSGTTQITTQIKNKKLTKAKETKEKDWSWKEMLANSKQDGIFKPSKLWFQPTYLNASEKLQDGDIAIFIVDYHMTKDGKFTKKGEDLLKKVLELNWKLGVISTIPHHTSPSIKCRAEVLAYLDETGKVITIGGDTKPYKGDATSEVGSHIAVKVTTLHEIAGLQSDSWINGAVVLSKTKSNPTEDQRQGGLNSRFFISEIMQKYIDEIDKQPEKLTGRLFNFIRDHIRSKPKPVVEDTVPAGSGGAVQGSGANQSGLGSTLPPNVVIPPGQRVFGKNGANVYQQSMGWILVLWSHVFRRYQVTTGAKKGQIIWKDMAIGNLGQSRSMAETLAGGAGRSVSSLHASQLGNDITFHHPGYNDVLDGHAPKGPVPGLTPFPTYNTVNGQVPNYCCRNANQVTVYGANVPPCTGAAMFFSDYGSEMYNLKLNICRNPKKFIDMYGFPAQSADKKNGPATLPKFGIHAIEWGQDAFGDGKYPGQWPLGPKSGPKKGGGHEYGWREWTHLQADRKVQLQLWASYTQDLWNTGKWKPADMLNGDTRGKMYQRKYSGG